MCLWNPLGKLMVLLLEICVSLYRINYVPNRLGLVSLPVIESEEGR